jgi:hypothetical protein
MQDGLFEFLRRVPLWLHHQWRRNAHKIPDLEGDGGIVGTEARRNGKY